MLEISITTPLRLNPPTKGFPWDDLRKIVCGCQWMAKVSYGEKQDQKAPKQIALLNDSFGNRRFLKGCVTLNANFRQMGTSPAIDLWTVGQGNDVATTLPLEVFIQRNFVADLFREKLNFFLAQTAISRFCATFWGT